MSFSDQAKRVRRRVVHTTQARVSAPLRRRTAGLRDKEFMRELVSRTHNFGEVMARIPSLG